MTQRGSPLLAPPQVMATHDADRTVLTWSSSIGDDVSMRIQNGPYDPIIVPPGTYTLVLPPSPGYRVAVTAFNAWGATATTYVIPQFPDARRRAVR
jgi:hypothetical protein